MEVLNHVEHNPHKYIKASNTIQKKFSNILTVHHIGRKKKKTGENDFCDISSTAELSETEVYVNSLDGRPLCRPLKLTFILPLQKKVPRTFFQRVTVQT